MTPEFCAIAALQRAEMLYLELDLTEHAASIRQLITDLESVALEKQPARRTVGSVVRFGAAALSGLA